MTKQIITMKKRNSVPDRWLAYKNIGEPIAGTRFISFKVPLGEQFFSKIHENDRFTPSQLFDIRPDLGLIIDLTNTSRYYSPQCFQTNGIKYIKVPCQGRRIPSERTVKRFCSIVQEFLACNRNKDSLIGVHCTHGVNRTGFMICSYLIRNLFMNPREAISAFENARGHAIERQLYINALLKISHSQYTLNDDTEDADATSSSAPTTSTERRGHNSYIPRRSFESAGPSRSQAAPEVWATASRSTSESWVAAPGPDADPWPPASGSASTSWSPSPGPVAGPSRNTSHDLLAPGHSGGAGSKKKSKKSAKRAKVQSNTASRQDSDTSEPPWRSFRADPGPSHLEVPSLPGSSDSRVPHFSRGRSARRWHRGGGGRPTPRHHAPPDHLPSLPPPQSSSSLPSFRGLAGRLGTNVNRRSRATFTFAGWRNYRNLLARSDWDHEGRRGGHGMG